MQRLGRTDDGLRPPDFPSAGDQPLRQPHQRTDIGDDHVRAIAVDRIGKLHHVRFGHVEAVEHASRKYRVVQLILEPVRTTRLTDGAAPQEQGAPTHPRSGPIVAAPHHRGAAIVAFAVEAEAQRLAGGTAGGLGLQAPAPGIRGEFVEVLADVGLGQQRQLRVVIEVADVGNLDANLAPAPPVVRHLTLAVHEQLFQPLPLQRGDLLRRQPLVPLVGVEIAQGMAPAQTSLVCRVEHPAEDFFIPAAHDGCLRRCRWRVRSGMRAARVFMRCVTTRQPVHTTRRCCPSSPAPSATTRWTG